MEELQLNASEQWKSIKKLMQQEEYTAAIGASGRLLEVILVNIIERVLIKFTRNKREYFMDAEKIIGGADSYHGFELGRLVRFFRDDSKNKAMKCKSELKLIELVALSLGKDRRLLSSMDMNYLVKLRNTYSHKDKKSAAIPVASRAEAQYFISNLEIIMSFLNIEISTQAQLILHYT